MSRVKPTPVQVQVTMHYTPFDYPTVVHPAGAQPCAVYVTCGKWGEYEHRLVGERRDRTWWRQALRYRPGLALDTPVLVIKTAYLAYRVTLVSRAPAPS